MSKNDWLFDQLSIEQLAPSGQCSAEHYAKCREPMCICREKPLIKWWWCPNCTQTVKHMLRSDGDYYCMACYVPFENADYSTDLLFGTADDE